MPPFAGLVLPALVCRYSVQSEQKRFYQIGALSEMSGVNVFHISKNASLGPNLAYSML